MIVILLNYCFYSSKEKRKCNIPQNLFFCCGIKIIFIDKNSRENTMINQLILGFFSWANRQLNYHLSKKIISSQDFIRFLKLLLILQKEENNFFDKWIIKCRFATEKNNIS